MIINMESHIKTWVRKILVLLFTLALSFLFITYNGTFRASNQSYQPKIDKVYKVTKSDKCTFYKWFDPNTNDKEGKLLLKNCSSCHMAYYNEWLDDKHSMSQNNPLFLAIYKQFKEDHQDQNGNCALCHNPELVSDGRSVLTDLRERKAKNTNGISCDFCHKIESVDQDPLKKGTTSLRVLRTCKGMKDIRFGPLKDPIQPSDKEELRYNSLYKTSLYCAKCHDGLNGNAHIYSTFTEWINSPGAKRGVQCQSCHMAPRKDSNTIVDNPKVKHKKRPYYEVHSHSFLTENPHEFRKKYVDLTIVGARHVRALANGHDTLIVTCTVENKNFGHSFPTGSPMRNAILLLEVKDKNGIELKQIKGSRLPIYSGNLTGKPGKLFAKILAETSGEYAMQHGKKGIKFRKLANKLGIPAQDWWNVFISQDTRIKASESDISVYEFYANQFQGIKITTKLIWRNTWPGLAKIKKIELKEDLLVEKHLVL